MRLTSYAVAILLVAALVLPLAGCNTLEGFGRDASAAGDALSGAASKTKTY